MSITLLGQTCIDSFICLFECFSWKINITIMLTIMTMTMMVWSIILYSCFLHPFNSMVVVVMEWSTQVELVAFNKEVTVAPLLHISEL